MCAASVTNSLPLVTNLPLEPDGMMKTLRGQFILSHILPFLLIMPIAGLVILYLVEAQVMLTELSDDLEERAALIAEVVARQPELMADSAAAANFAREASRLIDGQVYLLDPRGNILAAVPELGDAPDAQLIARSMEVTEDTLVDVSYTLAGHAGEAIARVTTIDEQLIGLVGVRESITGIAGSFSPLRRLILLTVIGGMLLGGAVGYLLAGRMERPISRTARAVDEIAGGKATVLLLGEGPLEMRQLAEAVNSLSTRLRSLEEMRRRSMANIVHELGRPLGAVLAAIQVLGGPAGDDPDVRRELVTGVQKELTAMEPLLDDLSQLHAEAAGTRRLDLWVVDTSLWLHELLPPWREAATSKGLDWVVEIPPGLPEVSIDAPRMAQVVGNLLSNAIKFTTEGGIAVFATADGHEVKISIADNGPGIALEEQSRVFDPFYRGEIPQRTTEGLGVGLSIAQSLAKAHGGFIDLESAPGRGSVFTIHLPKSAG